MKVTVELLYGNPPNRCSPCAEDMDRQIEAQQRAIDGKTLAGDYVLLSDTLSILRGIKESLNKQIFHQVLSMRDQFHQDSGTAKVDSQLRESAENIGGKIRRIEAVKKVSQKAMRQEFDV